MDPLLPNVRTKTTPKTLIRFSNSGDLINLLIKREGEKKKTRLSLKHEEMLELRNTLNLIISMQL